MGGLIKTNVFNLVSWGIFDYYFKASSMSVNETKKTNINANCGALKLQALYYLATRHSGYGDSIKFECGIIKLGHSGNYATKYKDSISTMDEISVSVAEDGYLQITMPSAGTTIVLRG